MKHEKKKTKNISMIVAKRIFKNENTINEKKRNEMKCVKQSK